MSTPLHPLTLNLLDRMTGPRPGHDRFRGEPVDFSELDALALGDLWTTARSTFSANWAHPGTGLAFDTASAILAAGREREPAFRGSACRDYLDLLAVEAQAKLDDTAAAGIGSLWSLAHFGLVRCVDLGFDGLGAAAQRFLAASTWKGAPHTALALGRIAQTSSKVLEKLSADFADSPLLVDELAAAATIELSVLIGLPDVVPPAGAAEDLDVRPRAFDEPDYAKFAQTALTHAADRVRRIHELKLPYAADKAFTLAESAVIARLARVALARDEAWLPPVLDLLFRKVSLAPTTAKTVPSQSVAIGLGHAVEAFPTPESVTTLRTVLRDLRHAGVEKKLQRNVKGAERGLADRPEIALRLLGDQTLSKPQLTLLTRCFEAGLASRMELTYADWYARLATHRQAHALAGALVWRCLDDAGMAVSVLPVFAKGQLTLQDAAGQATPLPQGGRVMLWHPSDVTAEERAAWRDRITAQHIKQPFRQVFREHYLVPPAEASQSATAMFAGYVVSVVPFLGLARRERWHLDYEYLTRSFLHWTVRFDLSENIYPGFVGTTTTGSVSAWTSRCKKASPVALQDLPAATLSEILRAVDLLVSVSSVAIRSGEEDAHREAHLRHLAEGSVNDMAAMRREALRRVLAQVPGLHFDVRHLRLGAYAVHLATGRVTRDGEPIDLDLPETSNLVAVPWLPYDEKLLETICHSALAIARTPGA